MHSFANRQHWDHPRITCCKLSHWAAMATSETRSASCPVHVHNRAREQHSKVVTEMLPASVDTKGEGRRQKCPFCVKSSIFNNSVGFVTDPFEFSVRISIDLATELSLSGCLPSLQVCCYSAREQFRVCTNHVPLPVSFERFHTEHFLAPFSQCTLCKIKHMRWNLEREKSLPHMDKYKSVLIPRARTHSQLRMTWCLQAQAMRLTIVVGFGSHLFSSRSYSTVLSVRRTNTMSNHRSGKKSHPWYSSTFPPPDICSSNSSTTCEPGSIHWRVMPATEELCRCTIFRMLTSRGWQSSQQPANLLCLHPEWDTDTGRHNPRTGSVLEPGRPHLWRRGRFLWQVPVLKLSSQCPESL